MMLGDMRRKELALGRIKRLASSGLSLEPFVRSVFDLINDGVPNSPNRSFHVGNERSDAYICSTPDMSGIAPPHNHYFIDSPPEVSGARFRIDLQTIQGLFTTKTIWQQDEVFRPNVYRAEGFNETYRPLGWHHTVGVIFHEGRKYVGYYGIWRSVDQKRFSRDDIAFLAAAAPHITHGLKAAQLMQRGQAEGGGFAAVPGWGSGMLLIDRGGRPIAMDTEARSIFQQMGVFDGVSTDAFASRPVRDALDYVSDTLKNIFHEPDGGSSTADAPVYRLYHHRTGIVLKLRGVQMLGFEGPGYITVLIERGETFESRRLRLLIRWGLSAREAQVLSLIAEAKTGPEISILLRISHDTVRKHTSHILEKLRVETRAAAASVAREFA
jgi:DNA-binding CsgD family transcriptional regulator